MKIQIIGNGSFGTFLRDLLKDEFEIVESAEVVILAVPISAYEEVAAAHIGKTLVNVCSVQSEANRIIQKYSEDTIGIHPLFGARSPAENRNSILTHFKGENSKEFFRLFLKISQCHHMDEEYHDKLMAKTHGVSLEFAKKAKAAVDSVKDVPDIFVPNSFKLLRKFVRTLDDMPEGTLESILSNPYIKQ